MIDFLAGVPGKLKTLTDRLSATWAAKLDGLRTGLTDARMGYLDKLNVTGNVASAADVAGVASLHMTGIVKSIQYGKIDIPYNSLSGTASLSPAVTVGKAVVLWLGTSGGSGRAWNVVGTRLILTSGSVVTAVRQQPGPDNSYDVTASFCVVEFY